MKGVILAGGEGTRLKPLTTAINKHLLPIGGKPMIVYSLEKMLEAEIDEVKIISSPLGMFQLACFFAEWSFDCDISFGVQKKADGIGGALKLCEKFVGDDPFVTMLADNIFEESLLPHVQTFEESDVDCRLFLKYVPDVSEFGAAIIEKDKIVDLVEKPQFSRNGGHCVIGIYMYRPVVFEIMRDMEKSQRGEYEITDINKAMIVKTRHDYRLLFSTWMDVGSHKGYREANRYK